MGNANALTVRPSQLLRLAALALLTMPVACSSEDAADVDPSEYRLPGSKNVAEPTPTGQLETDDDAPPVEPTPPAVEAPPESDVNSIPWKTGGDVGFGIASKDTGNTRGNNAALIYGGYQSTLANVEGWATALYTADLKARGVRYLFAIQGPNLVSYGNFEIDNTNIADALLPKIDQKTKFILLLGHSSGSYVAHEFLNQVAKTKDPDGKMNGKLVYFNLDGGYQGFTSSVATKVKKAYWVSPRDGTKYLYGFNPGDMSLGGGTYPGLGGVLNFDASQSGCIAAGERNGCIHDSLLISRPHRSNAATPAKDYDDFSGGRTVVTKYIADRATEAGLVP